MGTVRINSVTIAAGTTGSGPFYGKSTLTAIDLGNAPWETSNLYRAFYGCYKLQTITNINNNVYDMSRAFDGCSNLISIDYLPSNTQELAYCFDGCSNLTTPPVIPNSVKHIQGCFSKCYNLTSAPILPNSLVDSMAQTFLFCTNLTIPPNIPTGITQLGECFGGCVNLTSAPIIPSSVTNLASMGFVGGGCFANCYNLTGDIYILSTNIKNAQGCFANTTLSKNVYLPYNTSLGIISNTYNAFINAGYTTTGSKNGVYLKENPYFKVFEDWWYCSYDGMIYKYLNTSTTLTIPNTINGKSTCLDGSYAFSNTNFRYYNGQQLTSINFNNTLIVNSLERFLSGASTITSIQNLNISNTIKTANFAFYSCNNITAAPTLPDGITEMCNTYQGCLGLTSMPHIPNTVINAYGTFTMCDYNSWSTTMIFPDSIKNYYAITSTNKDPNKAFNITIGKNAVDINASFGKFYGNCYIRSNQITSAGTCFQFRNNFRKNIYIPFKNTDGTNSATYNAFINAGYRTDGSFCNVYLYNYPDLYSEY